MEHDYAVGEIVSAGTDFNSHAHVEHDKFWHNSQVLNLISTHTLTWSVTQTKTENLDLKNNFNSHAHVERDAITLVNSTSNTHFNSHAHVERDKKRKDSNKTSNYFNSHAHVERDRCY